MVNIARKRFGPFVRRLDLHGLAGLRSNGSACLVQGAASEDPHQRTHVINMRAKHSSPTRTPRPTRLPQHFDGPRSTCPVAVANLKHCKLAGLPCVDNTTLCVLAATAPNLDTWISAAAAASTPTASGPFFAIQESETTNLPSPRTAMWPRASASFVPLASPGSTATRSPDSVGIGPIWRCST